MKKKKEEIRKIIRDKRACLAADLMENPFNYCRTCEWGKENGPDSIDGCRCLDSEAVDALEQLLMQVEELEAQLSGIDVERLGEILAAEEENRLIVLPREGETVYYVGDIDCEDCPRSKDGTMRGCDAGANGCPQIVREATWTKEYRKDPYEVAAFMEGFYLKTREEAEAKLRKEQNA